jgi:hypothetical protein
MQQFITIIQVVKVHSIKQHWLMWRACTWIWACGVFTPPDDDACHRIHDVMSVDILPSAGEQFSGSAGAKSSLFTYMFSIALLLESSHLSESTAQFDEQKESILI